MEDLPSDAAETVAAIASAISPAVGPAAAGSGGGDDRLDRLAAAVEARLGRLPASLAAAGRGRWQAVVLEDGSLLW